MKEKPSEWVAISDLMSGVMAVVMLMLVMAVLQKSYMAMQQEQAVAAMKAKEAAANPVTKLLEGVEQRIHEHGVDALFNVDIKGGRITLHDDVFARGSACVTPAAQAAMLSIEGQVVDFLKSNPKGMIFVEGYTDNVPVKHAVIDFHKFCAVYDDNYTLSAARAREARRNLVGTLDDADARRLIVAGYGDSRPLPNLLPSDPRNRRVEVMFTVDAGTQ